MEPETILSQLEPLRPPEAISWWPPAPGWWLLLGALLLGGLALLRWWLQRRRARRPLSAARRTLQELQELPQLGPAEAGTLAAVLRRVALHANTRGVHTLVDAPGPAALVGAEWVNHLNRLAGADRDLLPETLADLAYRPETAHAEISEALSGALCWLRRLEARW